MLLDLAPAAQDYGAAGVATTRFSGLRGDVIVLMSTPVTRQGLPLQPRQTTRINQPSSNMLFAICGRLRLATFSCSPLV